MYIYIYICIYTHIRIYIYMRFLKSSDTRVPAASTSADARNARWQRQPQKRRVAFRESSNQQSITLLCPLAIRGPEAWSWKLQINYLSR